MHPRCAEDLRNTRSYMHFCAIRQTPIRKKNDSNIGRREKAERTFFAPSIFSVCLTISEMNKT